MALRVLTLAILASSMLVTISAMDTITRCRDAATYRVTFRNLLIDDIFRGLIPPGGLVYSPLSGFSHSNRISFLTVRGFASRVIEKVAETGDNSDLIRFAERSRTRGRGIKTVANSGMPTLPGDATTLTLEVDCKHPFVTILGMIAPSPDWIVQISNRNLLDSSGLFIRESAGDLIAYDAGVDSGRDFTDPSDTSLDQPTQPRQNIAPLVEDETDRFEGRVVGSYTIRRV